MTVDELIEQVKLYLNKNKSHINVSKLLIRDVFRENCKKLKPSETYNMLARKTNSTHIVFENKVLFCREHAYCNIDD